MQHVDVLVKLFSDEPIENVMAMIKYHPKRIIYLGHKENMITKKIKDIEQYKSRRYADIELEFLEIPRDNLDSAIQTVNTILDDTPDASFDLTGGSELILIAIGYITSFRSIRKIRIDPFTGREIEIIDKKVNATEYHYSLTVAEDIILHGGILTNRTGSIADWKFTPQFRSDIRVMWSLCQQFKNDWNKHCSRIDELKKQTDTSSGWINLSKAQLGGTISFLNALRNLGMIKEYYESKKNVSFRYKNDMVRKIISKAGNILELHVYEVATRDGYGFTDAVIGAHIDWDGELHDASNPGFDTINEIDVVLMKSVSPIFISCKSGKAGGLALHELETVSRKFGGKYARKALVLARNFDDTTGTQFFRQRAKDMKIWIIDNVFGMSDAELLRRLKMI